MHGTDRREWMVLARSEVGRGSGGAGGGRGGGSEEVVTEAVCVQCLPGLKRTTANPRSDQFNVFARLEVLNS
eukprot:7210159-Prymnesium_polylepis.1